MASEAAAVFDMATAIAAMAAQGTATGMRIEEGISEYGRAIEDIQAQTTEARGEATRRVGAALGEGTLALKEQGAQSAFESRMAITKAEMVAGAETSRLAKSGVRGGASPLLAAQQNVDLAFAAADRTVESGKTGMALGGLRLKNEIGGIRAQETLLTNEYSRRRMEMEKQRTYLKENKQTMIDLAVAGGLPGLANSFYRAATTTWDWK